MTSIHNHSKKLLSNVSMSHEAVVLVCHVAGLLFIYVVSIPIITYYTYRFYQRKSNPIMKHRDVLFVVSLNCLIIFGFVTQRTLSILYNLGAIPFPLFLQGLFSGITVWGTIDLVCIKSYLLYFQHQYHLSIQNASWKKFIDSSWTDHDWYLRNKTKWGQFSYVIRWLSIPFVLTMVFEALGATVLGWIGMFIFHVIAVFVPIILLVIFSYRLRTFYDIYGIRKEIISQLFAFAMCGVIYFIAASVLQSIFPNDEEQRAHLLRVFGSFVIIISFSFVGFSSVYYPLYLVRQRHQTAQQEKSVKRIYFLAAIRDPTMLSLLMQHSVTEFNTENLLFIIETVQIKHAYATAKNNVIQTSNRLAFAPNELKESATSTLVIDFNEFKTAQPRLRLHRMNSSHSKEDVASCITSYLIGNGCVKIELSCELPVSDVLTKDPNDIKAQITALCHKYVADGSCLELNLPFELKQSVLSFVAKEDSVEGDWFWAMDETCLHLMNNLLVGMVDRFQKTEPLQRYLESKEYQTSIKEVELIDLVHKPGVYDGVLYEQIVQKYI
eukprot:902171_1